MSTPVPKCTQVFHANETGVHPTANDCPSAATRGRWPARRRPSSSTPAPAIPGSRQARRPDHGLEESRATLAGVSACPHDITFRGALCREVAVLGDRTCVGALEFVFLQALPGDLVVEPDGRFCHTQTIPSGPAAWAACGRPGTGSPPRPALRCTRPAPRCTRPANVYGVSCIRARPGCIPMGDTRPPLQDATHQTQDTCTSTQDTPRPRARRD